MRPQALIGKILRRGLAHYGKELVGRDRFGHNAYGDIRRLANAWQIPIDVFFDIGANDGATVVEAMARLSPAQIFAFEPHPGTFARLEERVGNWDGVKLARLALGAEPGERPMFVYDSATLNSLVPNAQYAVRFGKTSVPIQVPCSTVDAFCEGQRIPRIDVMKIDTEGFELEVLQGARGMLERGAVKFIYAEFNDILPRPDRVGGALAPLAELVGPYGFRFIASYTDYVVTSGDLFGVSNALFACSRAGGIDAAGSPSAQVEST